LRDDGAINRAGIELSGEIAEQTIVADDRVEDDDTPSCRGVDDRGRSLLQRRLRTRECIAERGVRVELHAGRAEQCIRASADTSTGINHGHRGETGIAARDRVEGGRQRALRNGIFDRRKLQLAGRHCALPLADGIAQLIRDEAGTPLDRGTTLSPVFFELARFFAIVEINEKNNRYECQQRYEIAVLSDNPVKGAATRRLRKRHFALHSCRNYTSYKAKVTRWRHLNRPIILL
jgi:hypothetical protein